MALLMDKPLRIGTVATILRWERQVHVVRKLIDRGVLRARRSHKDGNRFVDLDALAEYMREHGFPREWLAEHVPQEDVDRVWPEE